MYVFLPLLKISYTHFNIDVCSCKGKKIVRLTILTMRQEAKPQVSYQSQWKPRANIVNQIKSDILNI